MQKKHCKVVDDAHGSIFWWGKKKRQRGDEERIMSDTRQRGDMEKREEKPRWESRDRLGEAEASYVGRKGSRRAAE